MEAGAEAAGEHGIVEDDDFVGVDGVAIFTGSSICIASASPVSLISDFMFRYVLYLAMI